MAAQLVEVIGFAPSSPQLKAKSAFWVAWRADPLADPAYMTAGEIAQRAACPQVATWWADKSFRDWFLNKDTRLQQLEYAFDLLMTQIVAELERGGLEIKELAQLGALLLTIHGGGVGGRKGGKDDKDPGKELTPEQAEKVFHEAATRMGYVKAVPAPTPALAAQEPSE